MAARVIRFRKSAADSGGRAIPRLVLALTATALITGTAAAKPELDAVDGLSRNLATDIIAA